MTIEQILRQDPLFVGFDRIFDRVNAASKLTTVQKYPPYNIVKTDENTYLIELAVAGFGPDDVDIELYDGVLAISGKVDASSDDSYIYKGIANRSFERRFTLADTVEVEGVDLHQGILTVRLKNVIPEEKKPRKIPIGKPVEKQLLTE
jgi:molecular chaperone IbpA